MKLYEPLQHLSFTKLPNEKPGIYLKSTVSILVNAGETLTRYYSENEPPIVIKYKAVKDEQWTDMHIFDDILLVEVLKANHTVKVIVFKLDGLVGGQVTTTISGDAEIKEE
nr:hypothetical protein [Bacteroidota bacterium]